MELLDLLGNYYDSSAQTYKEVDSELDFKIKMVIDGFEEGNILSKMIAEYEGELHQVGKSWRGYSNSIVEIANKLVENFSINKKLGHSYSGQREKFSGNIMGSNTIWKLNSANDHAFHKFIEQELDLENRDTIPKEVVLNVKLIREECREARDKALLTDTNGLRPQQYFAEFFSDKFRQPTGKEKYQIQNAFNFHSLKGTILNYNHKGNQVFLFEYLYGKKLAKSITYAELFNKMANQKSTDLGIKDVRVLLKFRDVLQSYRRSYSSSDTRYNLAKTLKELGIEPKTDLKRWRKNNQKLEELLNPSQETETGTEPA